MQGVHRHGIVSNTGSGMAVRDVQDQRVAQGYLLAAARQRAGPSSEDDLAHAPADQGGVQQQEAVSLGRGGSRRRSSSGSRFMLF